MSDDKKTAVESIQQGLKDAAEGRVSSRGSFSELANEAIKASFDDSLSPKVSDALRENIILVARLLQKNPTMTLEQLEKFLCAKVITSDDDTVYIPFIPEAYLNDTEEDDNES